MGFDETSARSPGKRCSSLPRLMALTEFQESHHQRSPPPFHRFRHTGGFPGSADSGILGPTLSLQAWVKGSGRTRESSGKKQKAEERMNPEDSKATTRKGYGERPRCRPNLSRAQGARGGWHTEGAGREAAQSAHIWPPALGVGGAGGWRSWGGVGGALGMREVLAGG